MRAPRIVALAVALGLVVVACTGSTASTTTLAPETTSSSAVATTTTEAVDPRLALALPVDSEVRQGVLDNGLTYYIRHNEAPGGRAELRLVVDAGSVQEDESQAGIAHFLEHMMFNGTELFPRNELISVLERFGPKFGPDINAYTTFDETVYELGLTTDEPKLMDLGMTVLREWASRATLNESDVVEERGVVLDEWRLRAQGYSARVGDRFHELVFPGTVYEGRLPIGTAESIEQTTPDLLGRFYRDWYRPDRMAIVAVGDFDVDSMEDDIVDTFGDLVPLEDPLPWDPVTYEPPMDPRVDSFVDPEATNVGLAVVWPVPTARPVTVGDYAQSVALSLGLEILNERLDDEALAGDGPLLSAAPVDFDWTRSIGAKGLDLEVKPTQADAGMEHVLTEVERVRREGFTDDEFSRALLRFETRSRQIYDEQDSRQDVTIADDIVAHHLGGAPLFSPDQRFKVEFDIADTLSKAYVEDVFGGVVSAAPIVLMVGPDDEGISIPDEARIMEVIDGLPSVTLQPRDDTTSDVLELMPAPAPAPILSDRTDRLFGYHTLTFDNGATVYLWPSGIAAGSVLAMIEGFGGTSVMDVEDLPEAFAMTDIVLRSGVGDLDIPTLQRFLTDRVVSLEPWISETRQGLVGESSSRDLETLLQLVNQTMTSPRFDASAVDAVLSQLETVEASRADLPDILFDEALITGYYGDDPRYFAFPTAEQLESYDPVRAEELFRDRFGDAGQFAFVFVGDFEMEDVTDLAARYIGSLPGDSVQTGFVDNQPLPPRRVQTFTVEAGTDEQAQIGMFFTNELDSDLEDRVTAQLLELIVAARLRDRVREQLSATYSVTTGVDLQRDPDPYAEAFVHATGDPAGLDQISDEVIADLADLQENGPTVDQFATAVAQLRDDFELFDNWSIASRLVEAHLYPDLPVSDMIRRNEVLTGLTSEDVRLLARIAYNLDQRIEIRQVPRN